MEQVSSKFMASVRRSHVVLSYVDVVSPTGRTARLLATGGDVKVDRTAEVRRTCSITCVDPTGELTADDFDSILTPYGTEIRPYRGIKYENDVEEVVPLGVFRISKVNIKDSNGGTPDIGIEAFDLSRTVKRDKFVSPYTVASGTNVLQAIKDIIVRTIPDPIYDAVSTSLTTTAPMVFDTGDDPWEAVSTLAQSMGCEIYFDTVGNVVIAPPVDIDALPTPHFSYIEGEDCTVLELGRTLTDDPGHNGVVLTGESPGDELPPVRVVVWDDEPSSPTYHLGPYGEVPMFVTDQTVKTEEDAQNAADALLRGMLGFSSILDTTAVVNPALDAGDVIEVERDRIHVSGIYTIDALNVPLVASSTQGLTLRQKRSV